MSGRVDFLNPGPILSAVDDFRGSFVDLDQGLTVDATALGIARRSLSQKLMAAGVQSGQRIVVAIGNGPLFVAALDAILRIGASPLLVHFQLPAAELRRTALKYCAPHVLTDSDEAVQLAASGGRSFTHESDWHRCGQVTLATSDVDNSVDSPPLPGVPLHPTSGSSDQPKIAVRPGHCAIAEAVNYIAATQIDRRDTLLVVTPMSHAYAYGMGLMVPLLSNARVVSLRRFAVKPVLDALADAGVTIFPAVPAMLDMLLFGKGGDLLARPRIVFSAGAPLSYKTVANFQRITGRLIYPLYGTTETGGIAVGMRGATPDTFQSVGPPLAGVQSKIVSKEETALGEGVGRVAIRSTSMMAGYLGPAGIDTSTLTDGWFLTGDVGHMVGGEIQLLGRESEVINVAGMKVIPSEVEEVLAAHPGVVDCKVYAGGLNSNAQFVKAAIVADRSFDVAKLRAYCSQQLVYYKQPTTIIRLDEMPRSPAGKIIKDQLP